jgi:hypothetical protein
MAATTPTTEPDFDPLVEFVGMWNTRLAERHLPIPELPGAKYECVDGRLFVTPSDGNYRQIEAALAGEQFKADEPFPIQFAPEDLLY